MDGLLIRGGAPLNGSLAACGSKNSALAMLAASRLAEGQVSLGRVPHLRDITTLCQVLTELGVSTQRNDEDRLQIETINRLRISTSQIHVRKMRASFSVLGPLVAKRGRAVVALPGGCNLGPRPIDLHLRGLAALGATIYLSSGAVEVHARRLRGARIDLLGPCGPTVTGTMNVLSAATLATGVTVIENAACEPEVQDLGRFLIAMGADIAGLGTPEITIRGVERLVGTNYEVCADRIETATYLAAAAITGGCITITQTVPEELTAVLDLLRRMGAEILTIGDSITLRGPQRLNSIECVAAPYPGVPTDFQPLLLALAAVAHGKSIVHDTVFSRRFAHVPELRRMGAEIALQPGLAEVSGNPAGLLGADVAGQDLRGAAALVLASLAAEGETLVRGTEHLERGYQYFDARLQLLGAVVSHVDTRNLVYGSPR
jgi:UDP-N-acetylglucosamine 1-carboxyvinyltransferase